MVITYCFLVSMIIDDYLEYDFLFSGHLMEVTFNSDLNSFDDFIDELITFSRVNDINISQYTYLNDNTIHIYDTNPMYDSRLNMISGSYPGAQEYLTNIKSDNDESVAGLIAYYKASEIRIYNFDSIKNVGLDSTFFINRISNKTSDALINKFSRFTTIEISEFTQHKLKFILFLFIKHKTMFSLIIALHVVLLIVTSFYLLHRKNDIIIKDLWGYNKKSVFIPLFSDVYLYSSITVVLYIAITSMISLVNGYAHFILLYVHIYLISSIVILILLSATFLMSIILVNRMLKSNKSLKGQLPFKLIRNTSFVVKTLVLYFIVITMLSSSQYITYLENSLSNLDHWSKAKNVYKVCLFVPSTLANNLEYSNILNKKLERFYQSKKDDIFLMDSTQFMPIDTVNNDILYSYSFDEEGENALYSPAGRSVTIDYNYLKLNKIEFLNDMTIDDVIDHSENTLNLLVPEKLKQYKNKIIKNYTDYANFQKVEVYNIYANALGTKIKQIDDVNTKINIIYTKNNQNYFTYNKDTGNAKNEINDPIAILYKGDFHNSYLAAMMTSSAFIIDDDPGMAFNNLSKELDLYDLHEINQVQSVYKDMLKILNLLKNHLTVEVIALIVSSILLLTVIVLLVYSHFKSNAKEIIIKSIFGYSVISINSKLILSSISANTLLTLILLLSTSNAVVIVISLLITSLEIILIYLLSRLILKSNTSFYLKGDNL